MKKFLLFLVVFVAVVGLGLSVYFFIADNEVISIPKNEIRMNYDTTISADSLVSFKNRKKGTQISYSSSDEAIIAFVDGQFVPKTGGNAQIIIRTTNRRYSQFKINVEVCDGSTVELAYRISEVEQLSKVGKSETLTSSMHYELANDITLDETWTPIEDFSGSFDGKNHTISNMVITDSSLSESKNAGFIANTEEGAVVKNLSLSNVDIYTTSAHRIGSIVAFNMGTIENCHANGYICSENVSEASYVGGVAGENTGSVKVASYEGGIVLCDNINQIAGGVVGFNNVGLVSESYYATAGENGGVQNFNAGFGGIVGLNHGGDEFKASIYDSFFYIDVIEENTNADLIGGITYKDQNYGEDSQNMVYGNYFGGSVELDLPHTVEEYSTHTNNRFYNLLSQEAFLEEANFVNSKTLEETRAWNFVSVWEMGNNYPVIRKGFVEGSIYDLDVETILLDTSIYTPDELYNALAMKKDYESNYFDLVGIYNSENEMYELDFSTVNWQWGDPDHPIPEYMFGITTQQERGALDSSTNCVIKNLTLIASYDENVGLVNILQTNVAVRNIVFNNVTIKGEFANYVSVLAAINMGSEIYNVVFSNINVEVDGFIYGTVSALSYWNVANSIHSCAVGGLYAEDVRFIMAGGVTGYNLGNMDTVFASNVKLCANYMGGAVGYNGGGTLSNMVVTALNFDQSIENPKHTEPNGLYSGDAIYIITDGIRTQFSDGNIYLGGIAGRNFNGKIENAYVNVTFNADSDSSYYIYAGGVAGNNNAIINKAMVLGSSINVSRNYASFIGGITGANAGQISYSVVDGAYLTAQITANVTGETILQTGSNCSYVGGLVGQDLATSQEYSIKGCVSNPKEVQGFYAGGISAAEWGKVVLTSCGNAGIKDGGVYIKGYISGGLTAVLHTGSIENCYTICKIDVADSSGLYTGAEDLINLKVSVAAGLTTTLINGAKMQGCYAVVSFSETGVTFGAIADIDVGTASRPSSRIIGCVYQNAGNNSYVAPTYYAYDVPTQVSYDNMKGKDSFSKFFANIGSSDISIWACEEGAYPVFNGIERLLPQGLEY